MVLTLFGFQLTYALEAAMSPTGHKYGYSPGPYIFLGSVALLATVGDIRMLVRGGISGTQRIARHLWRMCFAFFIATASIFLARQQIFPVVMRKTGALYFLSLLPLILIISRWGTWRIGPPSDVFRCGKRPACLQCSSLDSQRNTRPMCKAIKTACLTLWLKKVFSQSPMVTACSNTEAALQASGT
jgi:hypothetical protein